MQIAIEDGRMGGRVRAGRVRVRNKDLYLVGAPEPLRNAVVVTTTR